MNKKIYAGLMAFGVAASFWACGSGEILQPNEADEMMKIQTGEANDKSLIGDVITKENCPECFIGDTPSSSSKEKRVRSSSSGATGLSSASQPGFGSSSSDDTPIYYASSSSYQPMPVSSSSVVGPVLTSSSSESGPILPSNDIGTCAPDKASVNVGEAVTWKFSENKSVIKDRTELLSASFKWTFEGITPSEVTGKGAMGISQKVTYTTSGDHSASVVLSMTGGAYSVACSPVHVNGAAISGCKCSAAEKKPDISVGAVWTVSGCTSPGANIVSYTWTGAVSDPAAPTVGTASFTKKNQTAAPTVRVANDDNSILDVNCEEVISVDATDPDYVLPEKDTEIALPEGEVALILDLPSGWHGGSDTGTCTLRCQEAGKAFTVAVGTQTSKESYSPELTLMVSQTVNKTALTVTLSAAAKCKVGY